MFFKNYKNVKKYFKKTSAKIIHKYMSFKLKISLSSYIVLEKSVTKF